MKNKTLRIVLDLVLIIVGIVFLIIGIKDAYNFYKENKIADNVRFMRSYRSAPEDNIYKYVTLDEANDILLNGTGLIFLAKTNDPWAQVFVAHLNEIAKEYIDEIYYLEMDDIDMDKQEDKLELQNRFGNMLLPYIIIVKDGKILSELDKDDIVDADFDGAPIEYFDEETIKDVKEKLSKIIELKR